MRRMFSLLQSSSRQMQPSSHWPTGQTGEPFRAEQPTMPQSCEYESWCMGRLKQASSWMQLSAHLPGGQTGTSCPVMPSGMSPTFPFEGMARKVSRTLSKSTFITLWLETVSAMKWPDAQAWDLHELRLVQVYLKVGRGQGEWHHGNQKWEAS